MADAFVTLVSVQPSASGNSTKGVKFQNRPQAPGHGFAALYEMLHQKLLLRGKVAAGARAVIPPSPGLRPGDVLDLTAEAEPSPSHTIRTTWKRQPTQGNEISYRLWFSRTPVFDPNTWGFAEVPKASLALLTVTHDHTGLTPGATYYYCIQAVNVYGTGPASPVVMATVPLDPPHPPSTIAAVRNSAVAGAVWFLPALDATSYAVYASDAPGVTKSATRIYPAVSPQNVPFPGGGTMYVRVSSIGAGGEGDLSAESHVLIS